MSSSLRRLGSSPTITCGIDPPSLNVVPTRHLPVILMKIDPATLDITVTFPVAGRRSMAYKLSDQRMKELVSAWLEMREVAMPDPQKILRMN